MKGIVRFLFLFLFLSSFLFSSDFLLNPSDVRKVMDDLFEYHVEEKKMSPALIARSFGIAIEDFDEAHTYLLQEEVAQFLSNEQLIQRAHKDYFLDRFDVYFSLNEMCQRAIVRVQEWRGEWMADPKALLHFAQGASKERFKKKEGFAKNISELKDRHFAFFAALLAKAQEESGDIVGKESALCKMCHRRLLALENPYLGYTEEGAKSSVSGHHAVLMRTVKALSRSLDAHTAYFSPEEAHAMKVQLEKGMCGIGVILREGIEGVVVADLVKSSPAEKSGQIATGDRLVEINGTSIEGYSFHRVLEVLRGKEGERVVLGLMREKQGAAQRFQCSLVRTKMVLEDKRVDVAQEPFGDGVIGMIRLYSFYEGDDGLSSESDLRRVIDRLQSEKPLHGLVLDLRDNAGGFLSQAVKVSGLFISSGVVVVSKYSDGSKKCYRALEGRRFYDGPLVVLVSKESASAAEIVAQALQDYGVAIVVGDEQTYGKGTIQHQTLTRNQSESFFKVTIGRYYTVSGRSTQIDGVKSDIIVPTELCFERVGEKYLDNPLAADQIAPHYNDPLDDIDPYARKWFAKYYLPTLQQKQGQWQSWIALLRSNSAKRLEQSKNFKLFLEALQVKTERRHGEDDLQMQEAAAILKDMILLQKGS